MGVQNQWEKEREEILRRMTPEEKIALITGADFFASRSFEHLGIPSIHMSDGPHGLRVQEAGQADHLGLHASGLATCFPSGSAIACSWDPELVGEVAEAIGQEARAYGIQVVLGPAMNIQRSPLCGRNFEYYSEDPYLSGKLAAAYIHALQSTGVAACPKHFACNNQEDRRMVSNSVVDERTLREIYLPAFEMAVKEGRPWSIMCAYNRLNGIFCSENRWLLTDLLRCEWGFEGAVISDWGAVSDRVVAAEAGMDLEMPGTKGYSEAMVKNAFSEGTFSHAELDWCAGNVFSLAQRTGADAASGEPDFTCHHILSQRAAEESIVLLKNEDAVLPLRKTCKIAVLGSLAEQPRYQGGGSSHVNSWNVDTPLDCLRLIAPAAEIQFGVGYDLEKGETVDAALLKGAESLACAAEAVILFVGLTEQYETEGSDRKDMTLPTAHNALIDCVTAVNPNTIVVLNAGAPVELPWEKSVRALLSTGTAGDGMGMALARILFGEVNPSGKLAETMPLQLEHTPAYLNFRENDIRYVEGVFVGYRWYQKRKLPVQFPFGHGLSYTNFDYSDLQLSRREMGVQDTLSVTVKVTNIGSMAGRECVQLYVSERNAPVPRPVRELKGFAGVELEPGQCKTVQFSLNYRSFAFYDVVSADWTVATDIFDVQIGASSEDIRLSAAVKIKAAARHPLSDVTKETTFGELLDHPATAPILCEILRHSPMYRPEEMPDAPDFLRNMPLWTVNHMSGQAVTPDDLQNWIEQMNQALSEFADLG